MGRRCQRKRKYPVYLRLTARSWESASGIVDLLNPNTDIADHVGACNTSNVAYKQPERERDEIVLLWDLLIDQASGLGVETTISKGDTQSSKRYQDGDVQETHEDASSGEEKEQERRDQPNLVEDLPAQRVTCEEEGCANVRLAFAVPRKEELTVVQRHEPEGVHHEA